MLYEFEQNKKQKELRVLKAKQEINDKLFHIEMLKEDIEDLRELIEVLTNG